MSEARSQYQKERTEQNRVSVLGRVLEKTMRVAANNYGKAIADPGIVKTEDRHLGWCWSATHPGEDCNCGRDVWNAKNCPIPGAPADW